MGREAKCQIEWDGVSAECTVLLEPPDLIVCGSLRRRVPLASLTGIAVRGRELTFCAGGAAGKEKVSIHLGEQLAERWKEAILTPPPTLAKKLGITLGINVLLVGEPESAELDSALAGAEVRAGISIGIAAAGSQPEMIIAVLNDETELARALPRITAYKSNPPVWIVYPKGAKSTLPETAVRNALRSAGFMDTKVASVDARYTALRFHRHS